MALCVACFIVLTMRRLWLAQMTIRSANYASGCANSSSRCTLDVFGMLLFSQFMCATLIMYAFYVSIYRTPNLMRHVVPTILIVVARVCIIYVLYFMLGSGMAHEDDLRSNFHVGRLKSWKLVWTPPKSRFHAFAILPMRRWRFFVWGAHFVPSHGLTHENFIHDMSTFVQCHSI